MKKAFLFFFAFLLLSSIQAQEIIKDIVTRLNTVDYIFEGKVIQTNPYKTADEKLIYTSNTIEITRIFKGNLACGTVEMITFGGWVGDEGLEASHSLELQKGMSGVFLASETDRETPSVNFYPFDNLQKLEGVYENQSYIKYWYDFDDNITKAADLSTMFYSIPDLYNFTQSITGQAVIDCNPSTNFDKRGLVKENQIYDKTGMPIVHVPLTQEQLSMIAQRDSIKNTASMHQSMMAGSVQYNFSNEEVISQIVGIDTFKYVDFRIDLGDDLVGKYLHYADLYIKYSTPAFGSNIATVTNAIQVTRGVTFNDPLAYQNPVYNNFAPDVLNLFVLPQAAPQNKRDIPSTPEHALTVRFKLLACNVPDSISFTVDKELWWSDNPTDNWGTTYSNFYNNGGFELPPCNPQIDTFEIHPVRNNNYSTQWIRGGAGDTLFIKGKGFGNTKGQSNVLFSNADDGGITEVGLYNTDFDIDDLIPGIDGWSDTLIMLYMPSSSRVSDTTSGAFVENISAGRKWGTPGTGKIRVVKHDPLTNAYFTALFNNELLVKYSVKTADSSVTRRLRALNVTYKSVDDGLYGGQRVRAFTMSQSMQNYSKYPQFKAYYTKALREWSCLTGIKWELRETPNNNKKNELDSINNIFIDDLLGAAAKTGLHQENCGTELLIKEIDMGFSASDTLHWWFDTTFVSNCPNDSIDIYYIILHELGHAHHLQHVIDAADLMYYDKALITNLLVNRISDLSNEETAKKGGRNVQYHNNLAASNCDTDYVNVGHSYCHHGPLGIKESDLTDYNVSFYPNPFGENISILLEVSSQTNWLEIKVYNILGKEVYQREINQLIEGKNIFSIDLKDFSQGIYFVTIGDSLNQITRKIIKL